MGRKPKVPRDVQRQIVQQLLRGDESIAALARKHRVSDQTIYRWQKQFLADNEDTLPAERERQRGVDHSRLYARSVRLRA